METLPIFNPADGCLITEVPADSSQAVTEKAARARAAQRQWQDVSLQTRMACISRFRAALLAELEPLAVTLTRETGKPIALSRNELKGLMPRLDFFLHQVESCTRSEQVFDEG